MTTATKPKKKKRRKPPPLQISSDEQHARFVKAARDLGLDESGEEFQRAFKKIVKQQRGTKGD